MRSKSNKTLLLITVVLGFLCLFSCKKDSEGPKKETPVNARDIVRYGFVTVNVGNTVLNKEEYSGKLGSIAITLVKVSDNELGFMPLDNIPDGVHTLSIADLRDVNVTYDIKNPTLTKSADETINTMLSDFVAHSSEDNSQKMLIEKSLKNLKNIYDKASEKDKRIMAMSYQANKTLFDNLLSSLTQIENQKMVAEHPDFRSAAWRPSFNGSIVASDFWQFNKISDAVRGARSIFTRYNACVFVAGGAAVIAVGVYPWGIHTAVALTVGIIAYSKIPDAHSAAVDDFSTVAGLALSDKQGKNHTRISPQSTEKSGIENAKKSSGTSTATIKLSHDKYTSLPVQLRARKLEESDVSSPSPVIQTFFKDLKESNDLADKVNKVSKWCNEHIPFCDLPLLQSLGVPKNSSSVVLEKTPVDLLEYLSVSVDHTNVQVVDVLLNEDGDLDIKVKIVDSDVSEIRTSLKYVYKDEFSSFSGSIPIQIEKQISLIGDWTLKNHYAGDPVGVEVVINNTLCPNIPAWKSTLTGKVTFTETSFSGFYHYDQYSYDGASINPETCELLISGRFVHKPSQDVFSGSYRAEGKKLVLTGGSFYGESIFDIIDENLVSIGGSIFERVK